MLPFAAPSPSNYSSQNFTFKSLGTDTAGKMSSPQPRPWKVRARHQQVSLHLFLASSIHRGSRPALQSPRPLAQLYHCRVPYCCCNKLPQTLRYETTGNALSYTSGGQKSKMSFTRLRSRCWQGWLLLEVPGENPFPCLFQALVAARTP